MFAMFSATGTTHGKAVLRINGNQTIDLIKNRKGFGLIWLNQVNAGPTDAFVRRRPGGLLSTWIKLNPSTN